MRMTSVLGLRCASEEAHTHELEALLADVRSAQFAAEGRGRPPPAWQAHSAALEEQARDSLSDPCLPQFHLLPPMGLVSGPQ